MLVTLEGLDESGKTTVTEALRSQFPDATYTREPTETWNGSVVNKSVETEHEEPVAELFMYTADHATHLSETIRPALNQGKLVISDRYTDSRCAYQGATLEDEFAHPMEYIRGIHGEFTREPDLTLYLDIDAETAASREKAAKGVDRTEYLSKVRENYERLIATHPDRFVRIDATQSRAVVARQAQAAIERDM
ncbi:thymidylate kinase [environmental halophage 1 AAJ-2005]|nr:thymidylate kinase [environmental halophage 1 AAJ-2005]